MRFILLGMDDDGIDGDSDDDEIDALVDRRLDAKAKKNFGEADRIRDELTARGVVLEDTPRGTAWRRG